MEGGAQKKEGTAATLFINGAAAFLQKGQATLKTVSVTDYPLTPPIGGFVIHQCRRGVKTGQAARVIRETPSLFPCFGRVQFCPDLKHPAGSPGEGLRRPSPAALANAGRLKTCAPGVGTIILHRVAQRFARLGEVHPGAFHPPAGGTKIYGSPFNMLRKGGILRSRSPGAREQQLLPTGSGLQD